MSMLVFTGASQFAFVGVLAGGGGRSPRWARRSRWPCATPRTASRSRRSCRSGSRPRPCRAPGDRRDDGHGAGAGRPCRRRHAFLATGVSVWCSGTPARCRRARRGRDRRPQTLGLDAMFPAAFLALLAPQLRRPGAPVAALAGVAIALALVPFAPAGVPSSPRWPASRPACSSPRGVRAWLVRPARALRDLLRAQGVRARCWPAVASSGRGPPDARPRRRAAARGAILVQTVGDGHRLVLDARVPALAVAAVLVWRRAPFLVVVLAAAATPRSCARLPDLTPPAAGCTISAQVWGCLWRGCDTCAGC